VPSLRTTLPAAEIFFAPASLNPCGVIVGVAVAVGVVVGVAVGVRVGATVGVAVGRKQSVVGSTVAPPTTPSNQPTLKMLINWGGGRKTKSSRHTDSPGSTHDGAKLRTIWWERLEISRGCGQPGALSITIHCGVIVEKGFTEVSIPRIPAENALLFAMMNLRAIRVAVGAGVVAVGVNVGVGVGVAVVVGVGVGVGVGVIVGVAVGVAVGVGVGVAVGVCAFAGGRTTAAKASRLKASTETASPVISVRFMTEPPSPSLGSGRRFMDA